MENPDQQSAIGAAVLRRHELNAAIAEKKSNAPPFKLLGIHCICGTKTGFNLKRGAKNEDEITCSNCGRKYTVTNTGDGISTKERFDNAMIELEDWIRMLHTAKRTGADKDEPEGSRVITISDTLANNLADCLRELRDTALKGMGQ